MTQKSARTYRVPASVQESAKAALISSDFSNPIDVHFAAALASGNPVNAGTIEWVQKYFKTYTESSKLRGGEAGRQWASKFTISSALTAAAGPDLDDTLDYYAVGPDETTPEVANNLLAVDDEENLFLWESGQLVPLPTNIDEYDAPSITEITYEDAQALSDWIETEKGSDEDTFILTDIDPEERNLLELAYDEIDWDEIDRLAAITADATGYSPIERSANATRQQRSGDGKFGGPQMPKTDTLTALAKSRLPQEMPLVLDTAARIAEYLAEGVEAPAEESEEPTEPVVAAGPDSSGKTPLYFAVVDSVDQTAVLDAVAIVPDENGEASAWTRSEGEWKISPEYLLDLQGSTPPPVVELNDEAVIKDVLADIDVYDGVAVEEEAEEVAEEEPVVSSAWSSPLYGEYGEIIPLVAAGVPGVADTPSDHAATNRLKRYWAFGEGTAKWSPGTPGDLTRLARALTKYVGPGRAWGLAQNIFKMRFGVTNAEYDKANGT